MKILKQKVFFKGYLSNMSEKKPSIASNISPIKSLKLKPSNIKPITETIGFHANPVRTRITAITPKTTKVVLDNILRTLPSYFNLSSTPSTLIKTA